MRGKVKILACMAIAILLVTGLGQAQQWPVKIIAENLTSPDRYAGDVDGDGDVDVIVYDLPSVIWYENLKSGWTRHTIDANFPDYNNFDPVDMDRDGDLDFTIDSIDMTGVGVLAWYENLGSGARWNQHIIASSLKTPTNRIYSANDIDGDGDVDVVTPTAGDGRVLWFENVAGGTVWTEHVVATIGGGATWTTLADMDKDKDLDVVAGRWSPGNMVWYENKLPQANWPSHPIATLPGTVIAQCADMDADRDMDVVTHSNTSNVLVWYENPSWTANEIDGGLSSMLMLGQIGDVDGDGDVDVTCGARNFLAWCENLGGAKRWQRNSLDLAFSNALVTTVFGLGDIDLDKDMDVIATTMDLNTGIGDLRWYANPRFISTSVANKEELLPQQIALSQNYPNPFNPGTTIEFVLPKTSFVTLKIYDLLGNEVATVVSEKLPAGIHKYFWDGSGRANGMYFYRIEAGGFSAIKKCLLLK